MSRLRPTLIVSTSPLPISSHIFVLPISRTSHPPLIETVSGFRGSCPSTRHSVIDGQLQMIANRSEASESRRENPAASSRNMPQFAARIRQRLSYMRFTIELLKSEFYQRRDY